MSDEREGEKVFIEVTDRMRRLVRLLDEPDRACEYDTVTHELALLVAAAIESKDTPCPLDRDQPPQQDQESEMQFVFTTPKYRHNVHLGGNLMFGWDSDTPGPSRWFRLWQRWCLGIRWETTRQSN